MKKNCFSIFKEYPHLIVAISQKKDGPMKIVGDYLFKKETGKNRINFFKKLNIDHGEVVSAGLVHGNKVKIVDAKDKGGIIQETDALLTSEKNLFLSITIADCFPVFIFDPEKEVAGIIHCGWRSFKKGIIKNAIQELEKNFNSQINNLLVGIGPGICEKDFEISERLAREFKQIKEAVVLEQGKKFFLDLRKSIVNQLKEMGILEEKIEKKLECTYCLKNKYFSYRREKKIPIRAMIALIGIRKI